MNMNMEEMKEIERAEGEDIKRIAPWTKQITARGIVASVAIGIIYSVIVMKLNLTTGLVPNLNVSAALLACVFLRTWTKLLSKAGIVTSPFTRQENTIVQTCAVACYSIAVGGGFGSYLLGLNKKTYEQAGVDTEGNTPGSTKEAGIGWMTGFLFVSSFVGLLALVPLRKETRWLGNRFMKFFSLSFLWAFFQWFYAGGEKCGFSQFPAFGLKAFGEIHPHVPG